MGIRILVDADGPSCLYFSVTEKVFGSLIHDDDVRALSSQEVAEDFLAYLNYTGREKKLDGLTFDEFFNDYLQAIQKKEWPTNEDEMEDY